MQADVTIHSRFVFWLKIILPLLALALLSTLFLFSRHIDTDEALPYARVDVEALARDPRLTDAEYSTVTSDGAALTVSAASARQQNGVGGSGAEAETLIAAYKTPDGLRISISAGLGHIDHSAGRLRLDGEVEIVTSSGYRMQTAGLDSALDRTNLQSDGAVDVEAPYGTITAGQMELSHKDAGIQGYVLVFNKGVKLIYKPQK